MAFLFLPPFQTRQVSFGSKAEKARKEHNMSGLSPRKRTFQCLRVYEYTEDGREFICFRFGHFFSKLATRSIKCRVSKGFVSALRLLCATTLQIKAYSLS